MIRSLAIALALGVVINQAQAQQQTRATLLRSATTAYDEFQPERALDFAKAALDPALGPADTAWARGVHLVAQILVESNRADLARTWARWATRTSPAMRIDTVNFLAGVVAALREARTFTGTRTPGDAQTATSWRWSTRGSTETNGRIAVSQGAMPVPISARVVGGAVIPAGAQGLSLAPGTYEIEAAAVGYLPARVVREVLPGVTTNLTMSLTSLVAVTLPDNIRQRAFASTVPFMVHRYAASPVCAVGTQAGRDLVVTSYQAIRGADSIAAAAGGPRFTVAMYDVASDVAVLRTSTARTDSLPLVTTLNEGLSLWALRVADCRPASEVRTRVVQAVTATSTALALGDTLTDLPTGATLIDREGRVAGIWTGGAAAAPSARLMAFLDSARRNPTRSTTIAEVARRENHSYGSMALSTDVVGTRLNVAPIETWQWASLATSGAAPLTFVGPTGRYRVQAVTPGGARREQFVTIRAGTAGRTAIAMQTVAAAGPEATVPPIVVKKRSKMPWILAGVGGAGVAAALALGGGSPKTEQPPPPPATTGGISVQVPVNPNP